MSASRRSLVTWSWVVVALLAAHDLTHLLDDGLDTPPELLAAVSIPQWIFVAAAVAIVVRGDPARSRAAALLLGAGVAAGFVIVHLLPFSPAAFWELDPSPVSWVLAWAAIAAGLLLAALAARGAGRRRSDLARP
jgi:uncharacterized membrane protein (DUF441 family)